MWYGCKKQQENKSIVAVVQVVGGITITRQLHIVCNTFRFCSNYRAVRKFDSVLSRNYLFNHLKSVQGFSPIIIIAVLHSAIVTLFIRGSVRSVHVVDVHFCRPLEPSPLAELDSAEAKCDQEQNGKNT